MARDVGDPDATDSPAVLDLADAYDRHAGVLLRFARAATADPTGAEDLVQEVFLRAWRARERYRGHQGSQRTWLFAIARNVVVDSYRSGARRPVPVSDDALAEAAGPGTADRRSATGQVEDRLVLVSALAQLSVEHREVVAAVQLDGQSYQQLSERTGVPVPTLRTRMYYALRALRAHVEDGVSS